jgi:DNA (cytosine-5)-methyltransferase 1
MKRLLDLFCGAGGAGMGYHRAGFEVVGVDINPMPRYPFEFHQADALEYLAAHGHEFDAIHASPPCQAYSDLRHMPNAKQHTSLIEPVRKLLYEIGKPFVIENVEGAPLIDPIILCGTMFGLGVKAANAELWRHRQFELNWPRFLVPPCNHRAAPKVIGVYGGHGRDRRRVITVVGHTGGSSARDGCQQFTVAERSEAMGIDWMAGAQLSQAIPPAYTEFIGRQLMQHLETTQ